MPRPIDERTNIYLGIDPGASGGLAVVKGRTVELFQMLKTDRDLWDFIRQFGDLSEVSCSLEKVWGHTGTDQPGSRMFNFGVGYGLLRMSLTAAGIPYEEVTPQKWQKALGIPPRKKTESKGQWKNRLRQKAQQLFPGVKVTLATADALLIAEFTRRKHEGRL